ncbi:SusC/RagA family TonB-linked outer membrane protein [Chitinophaga nivalis]|uniref:SusC/RagA family TonB-linked outer membrane protein n=1 Tax=Chitinophaga nivalis TaxID=2991709 RepID=A0ABT3IT61_9BACT|nr:SusC/RagA family TonB-linked outer membrane protein [Chitinophaga nivalis]MCW3463142.1 SusC/RagA family TonB-linked outer membrane protein [Chitinophaga nivalis]MCW3487168.1 SusC/RagA family TonB-linked outer membrane protein [Chitinophaga nivalis]
MHPLRRMARCSLFLLFLFFNCLATAAWAQVKITGKVTDEGGAPLPGITVAIRSTKVGTQTDGEGRYTFNTPLQPGSYTLAFSGIGFSTKENTLVITANTNTYTLSTQLSTAVSKLDEIVVTGTSEGTTRRQLGNYISTVKADDLNKGASGNVLAALQGKTAGAQISQNSGDPAGGISVKLRGISTISGSTEPLYIVDGVIIDNSSTRVTNADPSYAGGGATGGSGGTFVGNVGQNRIVDINPADIERVEVLNGAAAAAIYGSRANAGVVQIFTKRGSSGAPEVSFSTSFSVNQLRKKLEVNQAPLKFGGSPDVSTQNILTPDVKNTTPVNRYDYQDYIFRTGVGTDNNLSVAGGKDKTKYYASASYFYNQGIIKNTDFSRYSFRLNLDQEINSWISMNASLNYVYSKSNEKPDGNTFYSPMNSVTILGNYYDIQKRDALGQLMSVGERGRVNPVSVIEDFRQQQQVGRIIAGAGVKLRPIKNLTVDYRLGIDHYNQDGTTFMPAFAYNVSPGFFGGGPKLDAAQNGYASTGSNTSFLINHDLNATYNWDINENLSSVTQVGYSLQYQRQHYALQQGRGLPPFVQTADRATTIIPGADQRTELSISGEFIQQNFKYRNQLFLTGALRLDGSSVFGKNERNQLYTKLSGSYVLSGTDYWEKLAVSKWWNLLKLRAAYGESGNLTGIPAYGRFNTYNATAFIGAGSFQSPNTYTAPDVKPERQKELEFGADLAFLNNRIGLSVNYYQKRVEDLLISRAIAPTKGYSFYLNNIGSLQNNGIEVVLNATPVKTTNFTWDLTAIFNRNRNKALDIGQALALYNTVGGAPIGIANGEPIGFFYGTFYARDANGNILTNAAGIPLMERGVQNGPLTYTPVRDPATGLPSTTNTAALNKKIGDPNPRYTATLTNDFQYKKFGLHIQLDAVQGVDVFNADFRTRQGVDNGKVAEQEDLGLLPRGYIAGSYDILEWRIDNGSFVKLRELALSYNVGKIKGFRDLTVTVGGRNLISWDNYRGYDPEVNAAGQSTILRGIDFGTVPVPRTYNIALRAKF